MEAAVKAAWQSLNWIWLKPKKLERQLREQGLKGNSYRFLHGDLLDYSKLTKLAKSKPIALSQPIFPRALPFLHHTLQTYGNVSKFDFIGFKIYPQIRMLIDEIRRFMPTKRNRRMKAINKQIQDSLRGIIDKRKKTMEAGEAPKNDLLGMLLESNQDEIEAHGNNKKAGMTTEEVMDECLINACLDNHSHQEWQTLMHTLGKNEPDLQGINCLKIVSIHTLIKLQLYDQVLVYTDVVDLVNMIVHEALRLYPPVVTLSRAVSNEGIWFYRKESKCNCLSYWFIRIWGEDVMEFKPERFSEGVSKATKGSNSFMPFGWGPRLCIGLNFAILEAKEALAMILQRFSFQLSPSYAHAPYTVKTLIPQHGAQIILNPL
ncbi:LOW QUALITY PROTEIN: hypothetical protein V2J09_015653 [Rumex salicifolius]